MDFKKFFSNKILIYLASRYLTYGLQFLVSLVIAGKLGPYYLGIYGFITLILNYFSQINFGIPHSLNVLIVHNKNDREICDNYINNALCFYAGLSCVVLLIYGIVTSCDFTIGKDYQIDKYLLGIIVIAILTYFNTIQSTVLRVRNKVLHLSVVQSLNVFFNFVAVMFFSGATLIYTLIFCQAISCVLIFVITHLAKVMPSLKRVRVNWDMQKEILHKGLYLFLYNSCFYFILISIRSIISGNYSIEEFGFFTFSFTIAHAVLLLLESLMNIIFPKMIDLLSSDDHLRIDNTLKNIRVAFVSSSHFLIYVAMMFFPIIVFLLPKYQNALTSMNLIALAILMNTNSYGYSSLLIAKNQEKIAAMISMESLIMNIILALFLTKILKVEFSLVVLATLLTYLFFSYMVVLKGKRLLGIKGQGNIIRSFFPVRMLIPYMTAITISIFRTETLIWVPFVSYVIFNWKDIVSLKEMGMRLLGNPNMADV